MAARYMPCVHTSWHSRGNLACRELMAAGYDATTTRICNIRKVMALIRNETLAHLCHLHQR
eukprot:1119654-Prorocentrum_lima.AAC.1